MSTITTRAGKGSPLTNTELDSNFTNLNTDKIENVVEDTTPQLGGDLDTNGNDITFGDSDKAIFGAGSDLQIYHDGSNSYVQDAGTGDLRLRGTDIRIESNTAERYVTATAEGAVSLFYDNSNKLATTSTGVNVSGTVTADGLTVDGTDTEAASSQLLKVRNSTTGEAVTIGMYAKADNGGDGNTGAITFDAGADGSSPNNELRFSADHQTDVKPALTIFGNRDIQFYEDSGTTAKFFWDASAESLGIGTTSPSSALDVVGEATVGNGTYGVKLSYSLSNTSGIVDTADSANKLEFRIANSAAMHIDSSGNMEMTGGGSIGWANYTFKEESGYLYVYNGSTKIMRVDSSGNAAFAGDVESNATL